MSRCRTSKGRFTPCSSKNRAGGRSKKPTRMEALEALLPPGYSVATYSPGDGQTRYRFFEKAPERQTYFGPASGIYTALGYKEAWVFAQGLAR